MSILRQYTCPKHGLVECFDDSPHCRVKRCKLDLIEMPSAPRIVHQQTKNIDRTARQLASDYGMTNIKSTREGEAQKGGDPPPGSGVIWGQTAGGRMNLEAALKGQLARPINGEGVGIRRGEMGPLPGPAASKATVDSILKATK